MSNSKQEGKSDVWKEAEQSEVTLVKIKEFVLNHEAQGLKACILDSKLKDQMIFWEVASLLAGCLTRDIFNLEPYFFEICQKSLKYLITHGNPKELLLALLEQADTFEDDVKFKSLLEHIQTVLLLLPSKREYSLDLTLETLSGYIKDLDPPKEHNLEGQEKILLEESTEIKRMTDIVLPFLNFLKPFVEEVSIAADESEKFAQQRRMILKHLMLILGDCLFYIDLSFDPSRKSPKTDSRLCAEQTMAYIGHLRGDFRNLLSDLEARNKDILRNNNCSANDKNDLSFSERVSKEGLSCLVYLIHVEHLNFQNFPSVLSKVHLVTSNMDYVLFLLQRQESLVVFKGIRLLERLISLLPNGILARDMLELESYKNMLSALETTAIYFPLKGLRQSAVAIFSKYVKKFSIDGRYRIFKIVYSTCSHSGFLGFLCQMLKEEVNGILNDDVPSEYFVGSNLKDLVLQSVITLEQGPATDIIDNSDRLIGVLNFLRYLILRDPPDKNITGFWNYFPKIQQDFLDKIRTGLDMSKAHYKLELKNLQEGKMKKTEESCVEIDLCVGGEQISQLQPEQQIDVIKQCLNTFDVIDSILGRVIDLADMQRQKSVQMQLQNSVSVDSI